MPRPPSKHGLEKKFKPWRKGKSAKSGKDKPKASCLKSQLRSQHRLLTKIEEGGDPEKIIELKGRIEGIKKEIESKMVVDRQRKNAQKSHGVRFLERQKLYRMEKSTRKLLEDAKDANEKLRFRAEMARIALDQVYVAHFPHDQKYIALFRQGVRAVDDTRTLARRVVTRRRILKDLQDQNKFVRVDWISKDQYALLPRVEWTEEMEKETFGVKETTTDNNKLVINDDRFALSNQQEQILKVAVRMEARSYEEEKNSEDSDVDNSENYGDSDNSSENADPLHKTETLTKQSGNSNNMNATMDESETSSDSESDSSDDSSDEDVEKKTKPVTSRHVRANQSKIQAEEDDLDDFLLPANNENDADQVFKKAKQDKADKDFISGDKSKGWKTQRQKPGEFKKPKVRR